MEIEAVVEDGSGLTLSSLNGQEVEISDWSYCRVNLVVQLHDFPSSLVIRSRENLLMAKDFLPPWSL